MKLKPQVTERLCPILSHMFKVRYWSSILRSLVTLQQVLQFLMNSLMNQTKEHTPVGEPVTDNLVEGVRPAAKADNLFTVGKRSASMMEEPTTFKTSSKVKAMLKKEKEITPVSRLI